MLERRRHHSPARAHRGRRVAALAGLDHESDVPRYAVASSQSSDARVYQHAGRDQAERYGEARRVGSWIQGALFPDGVPDLDLGEVFERAAEHGLEVNIVTLGGPEALDAHVLTEHLAEHALQVFLHLTDVHRSERRPGVLQARDGQPLLDLGDLGVP